MGYSAPLPRTHETTNHADWVVFFFALAFLGVGQPTDRSALTLLQGSTSAFCASLLKTLAPEAKVGLYTSPHLMAVRERIRINGQPLAEEKFAKYFFEIWDRYEENKEVSDGDGSGERYDGDGLDATMLLYSIGPPVISHAHLGYQADDSYVHSRIPATCARSRRRRSIDKQQRNYTTRAPTNPPTSATSP